MERCYRMLGLSPGASDAEVRKAYREALLRTHPDKGGRVEQFRGVQEAYEALTRERRGADGGGGGAEGEDEDDGFLGAVAKACKEMWRRKVLRDLGVNLVLDVTLAEVYAGTTKKLAYVVQAGGLQERRTVLVHLTDFRPQLTMPGMGDSLCGLAGDLVLSLNVTDPQGYRVDDVTESLDLYADVNVPLNVFLFGGSVPLVLPSGEAAEVQAPSLLKQGGSAVVTVKGMGLPASDGSRGELIVSLRLDMDNLGEACDSGLCAACASKLHAAAAAR